MPALLAPAMSTLPRNPFEYGRELRPGTLVDREDEVTRISQAVQEHRTLFLIGPRRYGKTSILREVEHRFAKTPTVILRYDAEKYETLHLLAQALLTGAMRQFGGPIERAGRTLLKFFGRLKPELSYNATEQTMSVSIGASTAPDEASAIPLLTNVLDGIEHMAADAKRPTAIMIDEFQQLVEQGGLTAERQLRSVVQTHQHVAYVFAGSKQRLLIDMVSSPARPFWQSGDRLFLGPIPRPDFLAFLKRGFASGNIDCRPEALEHLLDVAEDVPHNVQMLAHTCWEMASRRPAVLTSHLVDTALKRLVLENDPYYTQLWTNLTEVQKKALKAVIRERGIGLLARHVTTAAGIATSTMQKSLTILETRGITREEESLGSIRVRLEDPFLRTWLELSQKDIV